MNLFTLHMTEIETTNLSQIFGEIDQYWAEREANESGDSDSEAGSESEDDTVLRAINDYVKNKTDTEQHQHVCCDYDVDPGCLSCIKEGVTSLSFDTVNYGTYVSHLVGRLPASVETLNLGHDGIINCVDEDETESVTSVFERLIKSLPQLKKIYHCGYYSEFSSSDIKAAVKNCGRNIKVIKIY